MSEVAFLDIDVMSRFLYKHEHLASSKPELLATECPETEVWTFSLQHLPSYGRGPQNSNHAEGRY